MLETGEEFLLRIYLLHDYRLTNKLYCSNYEKERLEWFQNWILEEWLLYQDGKPLLV